MTYDVKPSLARLSSVTAPVQPDSRATPLSMQGFGKRLREARRLRKMSADAVADAFGISRSSVLQWEQGTTIPESSKLLQLPAILRVNPLWLLYNLGLPEPTTNDTLGPSVRVVGERVPRVAASAAMTGLSQARRSSIDFVPAVQPEPQLDDFAIDIWDDRNATDYVPGDYVILRIGIPIQPGRFVLAGIGEQREPTFGQLSRVNGGWMIRYINPLWGVQPVTPDQIAATMVAHVRGLLR